MASHGPNTAHSSSTQPASTSSWTEPPWCGWIETTGDALIILEAARRGLIPRVTRRLVDSERKMITSGSVFVFDEDESGIKRWTDGFFWSPSRILGNFLLYRETDKRGAGHRGARNNDTQEGSSNSLLVNEGGIKTENQSLSRPKGELGSLGIDKQRERSLVGSLTNSYKFKPDGMMKKTFSLTINGVAQHLISYYKIEDVEQGRLRTPSSLPELASLDISPEYLDKTHFRNPPKVDYDIDGVPRYRGEADEADPSPRATISAPLSTGQPLLLESRGHGDGDGSKRTKRYDPYGSTAGPKRPRKTKSTHQHTPSGGGPADTHSTSGSQHSQSPTIPGQPPSGIYASPDLSSHSHPGFGHNYSVGYYPTYQMGPPPHVFSSATGGTTTSGTTQGGSPPPAASGIVSPAPGPGSAGTTGLAYSYAATTSTGAPTTPTDSNPGPSSGSGNPSTGGQSYTYYPQPSAGHYAPYGGWTTYPQYAGGASASGVGDVKTGGVQQSAVATEDA